MVCTGDFPGADLGISRKRKGDMLTLSPGSVTPELRAISTRREKFKDDLLETIPVKPEALVFEDGEEASIGDRGKSPPQGKKQRTSSSKSEQISPDKTLDKKGLRLLRNRESAMKSRREKKANLERLEIHNRGLRDRIGGLELENSNLRSQLTELINRNRQYAQLANRNEIIN